MMRPLGDLEARVMDALWSAPEPLTVRDVLEQLDREPPLAYTTVLTVMDNLFRKGYLSRDAVGRAYAYQPVKSRSEHTADLMHELLSSSGDASTTLLRFVGQMSTAEQRRFRRALGD